MALRRWFDQAVRASGTRASGSSADGVIAGAPNVVGLTIGPDQWRQVAGDAAAAGGRLLALWASRDGGGADCVRAAFLANMGVLVLRLPLGAGATGYPGIAQWFSGAGRMQRAVADLSGLRADDADARPWLRHAAWPEGFFPLVHDAAPQSPALPTLDHYAFVPVEGDGVHEIAVGPVHAGIIEPGHFRFSVVGEKCSGWSSTLDTCTRASNGASPSCRSSRGIGWRRVCPAIPPSPFPGRIARRSRAWPPSSFPDARLG